MSDCVRPFTLDDVAQVADLHRRVFRPYAPASDDGDRECRAYFRDTFLDGPWRDAACPSLVYVPDRDRSERIGGFVGVACRAMTLRGRLLRMAVSSQFMVDANGRPAVAALRLAKAFVSGPQDLSVADEATDSARRLWEGLGGSTARLLSLSWVRVLRPAAFAASRARRHGALAIASRAARPICGLADALAARLPGPFRLAASSLTAEPLSTATLLAGLDATGDDVALRPYYDDRAAAAVLDVVSRKQGAGALRKIALRDDGGRLAGWYLYHATRGGVGEVVHVGARPDSVTGVLDHLFTDAREHGVAAVCGRLDPALMPGLAACRCLFHHRGEWVLVHSRVKGALDALHRGDASLSRLDGEWCLRYRLGIA